MDELTELIKGFCIFKSWFTNSHVALAMKEANELGKRSKDTAIDKKWLDQLESQLANVYNYFDERMDAEDNGQPNEEMKHAMEVGTILNQISAAKGDCVEDTVEPTRDERLIMSGPIVVEGAPVGKHFQPRAEDTVEDKDELVELPDAEGLFEELKKARKVLYGTYQAIPVSVLRNLAYWLHGKFGTKNNLVELDVKEVRNCLETACEDCIKYKLNAGNLACNDCHIQAEYVYKTFGTKPQPTREQLIEVVETECDKWIKGQGGIDTMINIHTRDRLKNGICDAILELNGGE